MSDHLPTQTVIQDTEVRAQNPADLLRLSEVPVASGSLGSQLESIRKDEWGPIDVEEDRHDRRG